MTDANCVISCLQTAESITTTMLGPALTNGLMALGGGGLVGFVSAYALKKIAKVAIFIMGAFVLGLMYLHHRNIVDIEWQKTEAALRSGLEDTVNKTTEMIASTASEFNDGSGYFGNVEMLGGAVTGFTAGFIIGLKKG